MSAYFDKNKNRWRYDFNQVINGQRIRETKLLPKAWGRNEAKAFEQTENARIFAVATGVTKERVLIQEAVDVYVLHRCPELKTGDATIKELALLFGFYDGRYLDELTEVAQEYTAAARAGDTANDIAPHKPGTIRNRLAYLRAACRYAQKHHGVGDRDVRHEVPVPAVRNSRQVYATRAEMLSIARKCGASPAEREARALIRLAFYSGMRLGEFMAMATRNAVLPTGFLLRDTKNGEDRIAPLHPKVRVLTNYLPFQFSQVWLQRLIRRAMDAAGFNHMHLHDLRHSTASAMINNGVPLNIVGGVLGHKDHRSTQRYAHLATHTLDAAILKVK
jgi:integrase